MRRNLGLFGVGAVLVFGVALVVPHEAAVASPDQKVCSITMEFEAAIRVGPSAGTVLDGDLRLTVSSDGAIDEGGFTVASGHELPVTGQISGRSISLLVELGDERFAAGSGAAAQDLGSCPDTIDGFVGGPLVGPEPGDLGDWRRKGKPGKGVIQVAGGDDDSESGGTIEINETTPES